jgi:hypothetical protein
MKKTKGKQSKANRGSSPIPVLKKAEGDLGDYVVFAEKFPPPRPDIRLTQTNETEATAAWEWELLREIGAHPSFKTFRAKGKSGTRYFNCRPFGFELPEDARFPCVLYDAFGTLGRMVFLRLQFVGRGMTCRQTKSLTSQWFRNPNRTW